MHCNTDVLEEPVASILKVEGPISSTKFPLHLLVCWKPQTRFSLALYLRGGIPFFPLSSYSSALKMEAVYSSEMLITTYQSTGHRTFIAIAVRSSDLAPPYILHVWSHVFTAKRLVPSPTFLPVLSQIGPIKIVYSKYCHKRFYDFTLNNANASRIV
jgi:hypothetical protein